MKIHEMLYYGLTLLVLLLAMTSQSPLAGSAAMRAVHAPVQERTSSVTLLNPALFHRLNGVLERALITGDTNR